MYWLKACPNCRGDLYQGQDQFGKFISCLQCSRYLTQVAAGEFKPRTTETLKLVSPATRLAA